MKRSRSRSGDGQLDRPLVRTLVFAGLSLSSLCTVEASIAGPCEQRRCGPVQTCLPHPAPSHRLLAAKVDNILHRWLLYDSLVETQTPERYYLPSFFA